MEDMVIGEAGLPVEVIVKDEADLVIHRLQVSEEAVATPT